MWQSLTGSVGAEGRHVLVVGGSGAAGGAHTMRSEDGGATWRSVSSGTGAVWHPEEYGGEHVWGGTVLPHLDPHRRNFVAFDPPLDPDDPSRPGPARPGGGPGGL